MQNTRQYVPSSNKNKRVKIILLVIALVIIFSVPVVRRTVRTGVNTIGTTVGRGTNSVGGAFASFTSHFRAKSTLTAENENLKGQLQELTASLSDRNLLARENADLKALMGRRDTVPQLTLASILEKPSHSIYDTLLIDGGEATGFAVGQVVYALGGVPIGAISETHARSAVVRLYSISGEKTEARLSPSNIDVTLVGRGGGNFSVTVPHDVDFPEDTVVTTKEISPRVIAVFKKITSDPRDPFQMLLLTAPVNVNELSFVGIRGN